MRLLKIEKNGELSLTRPIYGGVVPPYAILSHTWGKDEDEVTLQDLQAGRGQDKPGYSKILFCKKQAKEDCLEHFWIDTCCIDQTNSVELSEAINSMWRWYARSSRCYALLTDVTYDYRQTNEPPYESTLSSRWFQRGWTLQELIAPDSLWFFDKYGVYLGDKAEMDPHISIRTRIPAAALDGALLEQYDINERFSWAAGRETKRSEDRAYSLLGIFGVFMPLLYGEGMFSAFCRLRREIHQQEIEKASGNDISAKVEHIMRLISVPAAVEVVLETDTTPRKTHRQSRRIGPPKQTVNHHRNAGSSRTDGGYRECLNCGEAPLSPLMDVCPNCYKSL